MNIQIEVRNGDKYVFVVESSYRRRVGIWQSTVSDEEIVRQVQMKEAKEGLA